MRIHVTGGKGFLGRYITDALEEAHDVEVSDVDTLDVCDRDAVVAAFEQSKPDLVCHLAGLTGAADSLRDPRRFFEVNFVGTLEVLEACRLAEVPRLLFMSSLTVHGQSKSGAVSEDSAMHPRHPYGGSKASAELAVRTYAASFGLRTGVVRPTLIAGEGQKEPNAVSEFAEIALQDGTIEIYGDGSHRREWLHPLDVATGVRAACDKLGTADKGYHGTWLLSSGAPIRMADLAEKVIAHVGQGELTFRPSTRQAFDLITKTTRARNELGWTPQLTIDDIVERVVALMRG